MKRARRAAQALSAIVVISGLVVFSAGHSALVTADAPGDAEGVGTVSVAIPDAPGVESAGTGPAIAIGVPIGSPIHGTNVRAAGGPGTNTQAELSYASSNSSIVITFNDFTGNGSGFVTSTDGGVTFAPKASFPAPAGSVPVGDPGVVADLIGRFYYTQIFLDDGANTPNPGNCTNSLHVSTDGGRTFSSIVGSPFSYAPATTDFPDQPHIAIDRLHLVGGQPQLYVYARHFTSGINCPVTGSSGFLQGEVVCSTNGGTTWTAPSVLAPFTDNAHMATGSDGSVYIVGNGGANNILLRRSTADCNTGLAFGGPVTVASGLTYGPTGIDREGAQPYVAVDKLNPDVVYVAWSSDRLMGDNDRDIFLARCTFAARAGSCEAPVRINDNPIGDGTAQYFPLLCVDPNNVINLAWNDQRAGSNSTAIFHTEVVPSGSALSVGPNSLVSEINFTPFDFGGSPDYGDYNENNDACDGQHFYVAWSSQTSPPGILPASNDVDVFFAVVNNLADIRVQSPLDFGDVCAGQTGIRELEILNVGDATLRLESVSRIAGSPDISVDDNPTRPLTISADGHVGIPVRCAPTVPNTSPLATIRVQSSDADQPQIDLTATCNAPSGDIRVTGSSDFGNICVGTPAEKTVSVCNVGKCDLSVTAASFNPACPDFTIVNNPFPAVVSHDSCLDLVIRFTPTSPGGKSCNLQITSDDPATPTLNIPVTATNVDDANIATTIADNGQFGDICVAAGTPSSAPTFKDLGLTISNTGTCGYLSVGNIVSSDAVQFQRPSVMVFPLLIAPGGSVEVPIRFQPTSVGNKVANITVSSSKLSTGTALPDKVVAVAGTAGAGIIRVTGSADFGDVCADTQAEKTLSVCNVGTCDLNVTSAAFVPACPDFTLVNNPFPAIVSHDSCLDLVIRFTPTSAGPKTCTLIITSNSSGANTQTSITVTGNTPFQTGDLAIDVPPLQGGQGPVGIGFPPTVIQSVGPCESDHSFAISNKDPKCNLTVTNVQITTNPEEFSVSPALPSFPVILESGAIVGEGDLDLVFTPTDVGRSRSGAVTVTYIDDPITKTTATITRQLFGEGVRTGARVLVTRGGTAIDNAVRTSTGLTVDSIRLRRIVPQRNRTIARTVDLARLPPLITVSPPAGSPVPVFQFQREYGGETLTAPRNEARRAPSLIQLQPGSYQVVTKIKVKSLTPPRRTTVLTRQVAFDVETCGFDDTIVVDF